MHPFIQVVVRAGPDAYACLCVQVVVRADDTPVSLLRKVKLAAVLGTLQSTLTDFTYLRPVGLRLLGWGLRLDGLWIACSWARGSGLMAGQVGVRRKAGKGLWPS